MSSNDYIKAILEKLLHKYNSRIAKSISTTRRILLKPVDVFKGYEDNNADIEKKEHFHHAIEELLAKEMITVERLKYSSDVEKIYLCEDKVDNIYEYLSQKYGIVPQSTIAAQAKALLEQYDVDGVLVKSYSEFWFRHLEDPRTNIDLSRMEANLKMLHFLETNEQELYIREASMLVYGDSKWFENHNYEEICTLVRAALDMPKEENEKNDEVLALYHVMPADQEIFIKGNWTIEWKEHTLETAGLQGGIAISSNDLSAIQKITVHASKLITVENKTVYQRMQDADTAYLYLGGFANKHQTAFLQKTVQDNPAISYQHFGDIDVGGFYIHRHLCKAVGKEFGLFCMGIEQLEDARFSHCLLPLTDNDQSRLENLLTDKRYAKVLKYMKKHGVKLEQEIVGYYLESR